MHQPFLSHGLISFFQRPADRFHGDVLDHFHLDQAIFEQLQGPTLSALRCGRAGERAKMCLLLASEGARFAPLLLFVFDCGQRAALAGPLANFADRQGRAAQLLSNLSVFLAAVLALGICQQQDAGAGLFPNAAMVRAGNLFQLLALLLGQGHEVLFGRHEAQVPHRGHSCKLPS